MSGSEQSLAIYLGERHIATLTNKADELLWQYQPQWQQQGFELSPHLPLHHEIPSVNVKRFLANLLPEGGGLDELINTFHMSQSNTYGLIKALGLDIPGAIIVVDNQQALPNEAEFIALSSEEITARLRARQQLSLVIWQGKPRLSVAGVQDKINIVVTPDGEFGFGEKALCSTHLLKFEKQYQDHLVLNEYITMQLALQCGLDVAAVKLLRFDEIPALLVKRFDRRIQSIDRVERRHMIDGCQALNMLPQYKYERNLGSSRDVAHIRDGVSLPKLFEFAEYCANTALTKQKMIDWVIFNCLIFNFDAHGKNISFFVGPKGYQLTPFYDLVHIAMYSQFEQQMAMALGDEFDGDCVNAYQLADFADSCSLSRSLITSRLTVIAQKLLLGLDNDIATVAINAHEQQFIKIYIEKVGARCHNLLKQAGQIIAMEL